MKPRQHFGPHAPGRLAAVMVRALAAEVAEPGRYRRARDYARDGAVVDIDVQVGSIRVSVLGSRADAYEAEIRTRPIDMEDLLDTSGAAVSTALLLPHRSELSSVCTCPDDTQMCKHAVAGLLVFADEVTIEPELLSVWRDVDTEALAERDAADRAAGATFGASGRRAPARPPRRPAADDEGAGRRGPRLAHVEHGPGHFAAPAPVPDVPTLATLPRPVPRHPDDRLTPAINALLDTMT